MVERMAFDPEIIAQCGRFSAPRFLTFSFEQVLDWKGLLGRAMSASYVPKAGADGARVTELLRELYAHHADANGTVRLMYTTEVHLAEALDARS